MIKFRRLILAGLLFFTGLAHADWASDRAGSAGYVTVTTLASVIDEAVPFCVVYLSDMPAEFHAAMDAASDTDGKTIRVSTSDGVTQLACVPIGVNTSTDTGCLIFLGTGMSASVDVDYRIYVGNAALTMPTASGGMGEQAVFAAYAGVYFPGVDTRDFTSGGRTLTAVNSPGTAASGYEGITAATYNGTSQYHRYTGTMAITTWPLTVTSLVTSSAHASERTVVGLDYTLSFNSYFSSNMGSTPSHLMRVLGLTGSASVIGHGTTLSDGTWYVFDAQRDADSGTSRLYVNGTGAATNTTTVTGATFNDLTIGAFNSGSVSKFFAGSVAAVALSNSERSANFLATQKQNWDGNLYSTGSWTPNSVAPGTTGWVLFQTAATTSASGTLVDWTNVNNALVDDASYASASLDNGGNYETEYLNLTNPAYGLTVPTGAPSYTVEFRIKRNRDSGGGHRIDDLTVQFIDDTSTRVGSNLALTANWPTTAATQDYTLAGYTPDGTEFTSAAGLAIRATAINAAGLSEADVLVAWIKVSWTGTDTLAGTRGFFALTE